MTREKVLLDTGPLVAFLNPNSSYRNARLRRIGFSDALQPTTLIPQGLLGRSSSPPNAFHGALFNQRRRPSGAQPVTRSRDQINLSWLLSYN
jgi:hypothetical protein